MFIKPETNDIIKAFQKEYKSIRQSQPVIDDNKNLEGLSFVKQGSQKSIEEAKILYDSDREEAKDDCNLEVFENLPEGSPLDIDNPVWQDIIKPRRKDTIIKKV